MSNHQAFIEGKMNELHAELEAVRKEIAIEKARRLNAEDTLRFYANPNQYRPHKYLDDKGNYQNILLDDFSGSANSIEVKVGGKRAREYFARYSEK